MNLDTCDFYSVIPVLFGSNVHFVFERLNESAVARDRRSTHGFSIKATDKRESWTWSLIYLILSAIFPILSTPYEMLEIWNFLHTLHSHIIQWHRNVFFLIFFCFSYTAITILWIVHFVFSLENRSHVRKTDHFLHMWGKRKIKKSILLYSFDKLAGLKVFPL